AINEVMQTTAFIKGPDVRKFEEELAQYLDCKHVIGCANGTDALQLALMALDLPAGSEIITPDFTFVATAEVVRLLGFTPVLVDVDLDTFTIDIQKLREAITPKTKVIIPVHLFGQCADMDAIMQIAEENNLYVLEDTAQAIGTDYTFKNGKTQKSGTIGHIGCTSFFPSKNLGCAGDGGAVFTNDDSLRKKIETIANHGQGNQYYYENIGINSRLDTLQAAILRIKLRNLNGYNAARIKAADFYDNAFRDNENLQTPVRSKSSTHTFHQYTLRIKNGKRDELMQYLNEKNIPNKIYYPVPVHAHKPYAESCIFNKAKLQNTITLSKEVLSLPMHTELNEEQLTYITRTVNNFLINKI
ncbi:MAG: DegT/DnrJ/EryC1/StrS family aminotransferase, partial [Sphingobacteriales bacterium]